MSKQEEIREGIERILLDGTRVWSPSLVKELIDYLHSSGVVIKVDRRLPYIPQVGLFQEAYETASKHAQEDMIDAGFVAVEPLIEDK